ncbi:MAG: iron ABC transporter permease [Candidatus Devosia phytovorans]|uniref:Iron ABC transporter permease n=1 Tax=Candidatus Devosia phytovorans TaxID=3121372 RepID=A0AAJ5VS19_9HYPH|nr:iron ABC transporter permease [Devosia sp.]WEK03659.1 MAG: iron ABC transporter permease [Devosia sp.]
MSAATLSAARRQADRRQQRLIGLLLAMLALAFALSLSLGQSFTPPDQVVRILLGEDIAGASFTVVQLRLPRSIMCILAGVSFGIAGAAFQTMLRNPLASPDIIGISSGASAAAVFALVVLGLKGPAVSIFAVVSGLGIAMLVYALSFRNGVAGTRLILVGIGVSAMLESFVAYILTQAPEWNLQEAMRWLTGSVNGAQAIQALPLLGTVVVCGGMLLALRRSIELLRLGDDTAGALGVPVTLVRVLVILCSVGLIATATAVTGPIAFVAFLSGPIASRLIGPGRSVLLPAACVGALLVLLGDYAGQYLLPSRYPVGVITGALGAPYLIYLIIRVNRVGGTL